MENNIDIIAFSSINSKRISIFINDKLVFASCSPNYCYRFSNDDSVMQLDKYMNRGFKIFESCQEIIRN